MSDKVREMRDRTGALASDCRMALDRSNGDIERAIDILRSQGTSQAIPMPSALEAENARLTARVAQLETAIRESTSTATWAEMIERLEAATNE